MCIKSSVNTLHHQLDVECCAREYSVVQYELLRDDVLHNTEREREAQPCDDLPLDYEVWLSGC